MYLNLWQNSGGHPEMLVFCKFLKILMVSDKTIHKAFRIHKMLLENPFREISIFTIYQNYTLDLMCDLQPSKASSQGGGGGGGGGKYGIHIKECINSEAQMLF